MRKGLLLTSPFILLSACMVGPDYEKPGTQDVPCEWANATEKNNENIQDEIQWWKNFNDPILTDLVTETIKSNYDLKVAFSKICQARATLLGAEASIAPEIDGIGSFSHNESSLNTSRIPTAQDVSAIGPTSGGIGTNRYFNLYRLGLDTAWEIDLWGRIRRNIESANASLEAQVEDMHGTMLSLIAEVATTYINLRSYQKQYEIQTKAFKAWDDTYKLNQNLYDAGLATQIDVMEAKTTRDQTEAALYPLKESIKAAMHQLAVLVGKPPAALYCLLSDPKPIPKMPDEIFAGLPSELLKRRPDIRAAERNIEAYNAQIGVAMGSLFPVVTFTGTIGYQSNRSSNLMTPASGFYSFGPGFTWDIIDFGRVRSMIDASIAVKNQYYFQYKSTVLSAFADVENSLVNYAEEANHHYWLKSAFDASKTAYDVSMLRYESGLIPFIVVLQTEYAYQQNALSLAQSEATLSLNAVALYKALGGGWQIDKTCWLNDPFTFHNAVKSVFD